MIEKMVEKLLPKFLPKIVEAIKGFEKKHLKDEEDQVTFIISEENDEPMLSICPIKQTEHGLIICQPIKVIKGPEIMTSLVNPKE
jgi:hypothetical protein